MTDNDMDLQIALDIRASINLARGEAALAAYDAGGLDVIRATGAEFRRALTRERHTLKRALTDPRLVDGIGNAYADEILHRARLSPVRMSAQLKAAEVARLHAAARDVLTEWIERLSATARLTFPEKVTAFYWSRTVRLAPMAMLNMISSTVSQFTLLVGMIPIVYAVSYWMGHFDKVTVGLFGGPIVPMTDPSLRVEVFLSWAMTLLGCAQLAKLRFTRWNAVVMFSLWLLQFVAGPIRAVTGVPEITQHFGMSLLCIVLAVIELARSWKEVDVRAALRDTFALMRGEESA